MDEQSEVLTNSEGEKTLTQTQVNDIVRREKAAAAEKARREAEALYAPQLESLKYSNNNSGGAIEEALPELEEKLFKRFEERAKKADEEAREAANARALQDAVRDFEVKMELGKDKYDDFKNVMDEVSLAAFPRVILLASQLDNTAEVMYELAKNPAKLVYINSLANTDSEGKMAQKEMAKLSQSILHNEKAKSNNVKANEPLSNLKSSPVRADDGNMTIKDYRKLDWLRV
jgi:hypothetical protein